MSRRKMISQREAHRMKKRIEVLQRAEELRQNAWSQEYPGGVNIATLQGDPRTSGVVHVARTLGHAVVVVNGSNGHLLLFAIKS